MSRRWKSQSAASANSRSATSVRSKLTACRRPARVLWHGWTDDELDARLQITHRAVPGSHDVLATGEEQAGVTAMPNPRTASHNLVYLAVPQRTGFHATSTLALTDATLPRICRQAHRKSIGRCKRRPNWRSRSTPGPVRSSTGRSQASSPRLRTRLSTARRRLLPTRLPPRVCM